MLSYIQKAALKASKLCSSYKECKNKTYTVWFDEYKHSKCARYNNNQQLSFSIDKAHHIIDTDWVVQHIMVSCDQRCDLFLRAFSMAPRGTFTETLKTYITNLKSLKTEHSTPFIWIPRHPNSVRGDTNGYVPYHFPVYPAYVFFCTHLKRRWAHLPNVPLVLRPIPILPTHFYDRAMTLYDPNNKKT